ncbi:unnamed protein product [Allacma fusca]|uniref:Uncharacterized protein n=1 Tax=Allacma fusca TaxID=39272 RepID=A0A8J2LQ61_9HEXA|nr:unnamed protein product [Allacma fusca]
MVIGKMEDSDLGTRSWFDSMKTISVTVNDRLKQTAASFAQTVLECQRTHSAYPKYEIVLHDVIPSKTEAGWMFFGKVELRHLADENEIKKHINIYPQESGLRITLMGSSPCLTPCIDYGAIFHILNRVSLECCEYYENMTKAISEAKVYLEGPLIPISWAKRFGSITRHRQYVMIGQIIAHIQADHNMDSTIEAVDEILRNFNLVLRKSIQVLRQFTKRIRNEFSDKVKEDEVPFDELVIPMATDCITLLFQTIRRFLALGPCCSAVAENKSALSSVHLCLKTGINSLYKTKTSNIFSFHYCVQTLFAISQLSRAEEFAKNAILGGSMKKLTVERLQELKKANDVARLEFREVISLIDTRIRTAERYIDIIMKKGAKLGIIVPARTSGVLYSHRHDEYTLIRYSRNSYIRNQAKRLRQSNEVRRHTRKYVVEPDYEEVGAE